MKIRTIAFACACLLVASLLSGCAFLSGSAAEDESSSNTPDTRDAQTELVTAVRA